MDTFQCTRYSEEGHLVHAMVVPIMAGTPTSPRYNKKPSTHTHTHIHIHTGGEGLHKHLYWSGTPPLLCRFNGLC